MIFSDFYNILVEIQDKLKAETENFKKELLLINKEEIILEYLELYIYNRLKIFFKYVENEARKDNYLFDLNEMKKISTTNNFLSIIKRNYFKGDIFKDKLTNKDLQRYFKSI